MTLSHWFACNELHLSARATANFLDVVTCLDDPGRDPGLVGCALETLAEADPRLQALAVPDLVAFLNVRTEDELRNRAATLVLEVTGPMLTPGILASVADLGASALTRLVSGLAPTRPSRDLMPFADVVESAPHLLGLSLLHRALRLEAEETAAVGLHDDADLDPGSEPSGAAEHLLRGEDELWYFAAARAGALGRVPRLLATECLVLGGEAPTSLIDGLGMNASGEWLGQPDLVRTRLRLELARRGEVTPAARAAWLCDEAVTLRLYADRTGSAGATGTGWLGLANQVQRGAAQIALWQAVCWEEAVRVDAEVAGPAVAAAWGGPNVHRSGFTILHVPGRLDVLRQPLSYLAAVRVRHREQTDPFTVKLNRDSSRGNTAAALTSAFSPWLDRSGPQYHPADRQDSDLHVPPKTYPAMDDDVAVLRLVANARTVTRLTEELLRVEEPVPGEVWDLFLNMCDALSNVRLRETLNTLARGETVAADQRRLGPSVLGLVLAAKEHLDRAAKGQLHPGVPAGVVSQIRHQTESTGYRSQQVIWLYRQAALMTVAHLARESVSGELPSAPALSTPWLRNGTDSPGAVLLRLLFGPVWDRVNNPSVSIQQPGLLSAEIFPAYVQSRTGWDWVRAYLETRARIGLGLLLLSEPIPFERWQLLDPLDRTRFVGGAWFTALTLRLQALIEAGGLTEGHPWQTEWIDSLELVNSPRFLAREVRNELTNFLSRPASSDAEYEVQRRALRAVLEFSAQSIRYQDAAGLTLFEIWKDRGAVRGGSVELGSEWLFAMSRAVGVPRHDGHGPWARRGAQILEQQRRQSVWGQVGRLLDVGMPPEFAEVLDRIDEAATTPLVAMEPSGAAGAYLALAFQRRGGIDWIARPPAAADAVLGGPGTTLDKKAAASVRLGVTAGRTSDDQAANLVVNVGTGEPIVGPRLDLPAGAPVGARPGEIVPLPLPSGRPGDIVRVQVAWRDGQLTVRPRGRRAWTARDRDRDALQRWLPDSLAAVADEAEAECFAQYNQDGSWVPVGRDLMRLVIDRFRQGGEQTLVVVAEFEDGHECEFSGGLGQCYRVPVDSMGDSLVEAIDAARADGGTDRSLAGLRIRVRLMREDERLVLDLAAGDPVLAVDDVNLRWRDRFRQQPLQVALRADGGWVIPFEGGKPPVRVDFGASDEPSPEEHKARVRLHPGSWDAHAQRQGQVRAVHLPCDVLPVSDWGDRAVLRDYLDAEVGSVFRLSELTGGTTHGYLAAVTTTGLPVSVAADSLSFLPGAPDPGLVAGREVHVQRFVRRPEVAITAPVPVALDGPVLEATTLVGLVARRTDGVAEVDVWLDLGDRAALVPVPLGAFATQVGSVGARVTAVRTGGVWTLTCEQREPMARAAWALEAGPPPADAIALSVAAVPGASPALVLQAPDRPVLFLADASQRSGAELTCAVPRGGRVRQVRRGFISDAIGRTLDIVEVTSGDQPLMGHSSPGKFRTPGPWLTAQLVLQRHVDERGEWVDARREFTPGRAARRPVAPHRPASELVQGDAGVIDAPMAWPVGYAEWREQGNDHALASMVAGAAGSVRLLELQLPTDPAVPGSEPLETVPLLRGEHKSHLFGHGYDPDRVQVRLRHDHRGWTASYRTQPLTLQEFERNVLAVQGADRRRFRIWYVGRTPAGLHRFEWGYGWTMELSEDQLSVREGRLSLFFNDCLTDLSVVARRGADGSDQFVLQIGYVRWEIERLVRDDAAQGMLHQVKLQLRTLNGGRTLVDVKGVYARTRTLSDAGGDVRATTFARMFHAEFDRNSELLIERLGSRVRDGTVMTVLARLDQSREPGVGDVTRSRFTLLSTDPDLGGEERLPRPGESLILVAGTIRRTGGGKGMTNDYELPFELNLDPDVDVPRLEVRVLRTQFSFRESALRQAFRSGSPDRYSGVPMLVTLIKHDRNGWLGSVVDAPPRPWIKVRQWVRSDPDNAQVTVGERRDEGTAVLVEPWPGVIGRFELKRQPAPPKGSLCRIGVKDGGLLLVPLVQGGRRYVPDGGRPVMLLLKDNVLRRRDTKGRGGFTVAGLPGVRVDDDAAAAQAKYRRPPRLGMIQRVGPAFKLVSRAFVRAARLGTAEDRPQVRVFGKREEPPRLDWPQLSYRDRAPNELVQHTRRGAWRYHDEMTGFLKDGRLEEVRFPDPVRSSDGPLFLDDRWRLRYDPSDLLRFGFGAAEVLEHGLPNDNDWYPVAGPARGGGIWVELSPGRVSEFSGALLRSAALTTNLLDRLPWGLFAAGDEVLLDGRRTRDSAVSGLVLKSWRPGPRGWFGKARALLVPGTDQRARSTLGSGCATLIWSGTGKLGEGPVWLYPDNMLAPYTDDVTPGDVVVLREAAGQKLLIDGAEQLAVRLADEWGPQEWLRGALVDSRGRGLVLGPLGGALPVVVTAVDFDGVVVGPVTTVPTGDVLAVIVLGQLDADRVLVRSGTALLPLALADLVPGVPKDARGVVVERLVHLGQLTWLHQYEGRWVSPALTKPKHQTFRARVMAAVPGGLLLVSEVDLAWEWLPLSELGTVVDDTAEVVFAFLRNAGSILDVVETGPGVVSFLQTHEGRRVRRHLASGDAVLAVPQALIEQESRHTWTYLASVHPTIAIITLQSETELALGEPIAIEMDNLRGTPTAIPQGQDRTAILLAPWLLIALREARTAGSIDFNVIAEHAAPHVDPYLAGVDGGREARLVSALRERLKTPGEPADESVRSLVDGWLSGPGGAMLTGQTWTTTAPDSGDWDLVPHLAGSLLLAELGTVSPLAAALSVHAGFRLGQLAIGAVHQEVLLRDWLLRDRQDVRYGRWVRLDHLDLGGRTVPRERGNDVDPYVRAGALSDPQFDGLLTRSQYAELRNATEGVLGAWLEPDGRLRSTARMLAFAVGDFDHMDEVLADFATTQLARVAALGRGLTPGPRTTSAQPRLTVWQIDEMRRQLSACLTQRLPLTLLPDNAAPLPGRLTAWAEAAIEALLAELG